MQVGSRAFHRLETLRTAEDARAGLEVHQAIWIASVKRSDAGMPVQVFLRPSSMVHIPAIVASDTAVASEVGILLSDATRRLRMAGRRLRHR